MLIKMASLLIDNDFSHQSYLVTEGKTDGNSDEIDVDESIPEHKQFISVEDFQNEHLPQYCRSNVEFMKYIQIAIDRTVKITISFTSEKRPDTFLNSTVPYPFNNIKGCSTIHRSGTGYIDEFVGYEGNQETSCTCKRCKTSSESRGDVWKFIASTSTHLVYDREEAENATIVLFYDSENTDKIEYLYGVDVLGDAHERYLTDYCRVVCVTHDASLGNKLKQFCEETDTATLPSDFGDWNSPTGILISHPHGTCKKISVGNIYHRCLIRHPDAMSFKLHKGRYCRLPSCSPERENKKQCDSANKCFSECRLNDTEKGEEGGKTETNFSNAIKYGTILEKTLLAEDIAQLTIDVKVILPKEAKHHMQRRIKDDSMHWYVFPPDTKFTSPEGKTILFPRNMEFFMPNVHAVHTNDQSCNSWYLTYDMASQPGSSGARVLDVFRHNNHQHFHHFGSFPQHNMSGLIRGYYFVPNVDDF